jgi:hypothetical protein
VPPFHFCDECGDIVEHQVEIERLAFVCGMDSNLGWRQAKNQPAIADVNMRELQDVAEKLAIGLSVGAVDNRMCACKHGQISLRRNKPHWSDPRFT